MLLKIMIVDDESIVRKDFKYMIGCADEAYKIVAEAANGKEALEKFNEHRPDVVITDIKMPLMDGIELAECILRDSKETKIILLSSYAEFHLAQKAIHLGVHAYLLKHEMDSVILFDYLNKLFEQIGEERKIERSKTMIQLMQSNMDAEAEQELLDKLDLTILKRSFILIVFDIEDEHESEKKASMTVPVLSEREFSSIIGDHMTGPGLWELMQMAEREYVCILKADGAAGESQMMQEVRTMVINIQASMKMKHQMTAAVAVSGLSSPGESISGLYRQTAAKLKYKVFYKGQAIVTGIPPESSGLSGLTLQKTTLDRLKHHFYQGEYEQVQVCLKKLLLDHTVERQDLTMLNKAVDGLLLFVRDFVSERNRERADQYDPYKMHEEVYRLGSVYKIYDWFLILFDKLRQEYNHKYCLKVLKALHYIHTHFNKDIGLEELSRVMEVSPIYASLLFKKEVGETYKSYLAKHRVHTAEALLRTGSYKIYEIGNMVGYQTTAYFCRIFKQITGKNPSDYEYRSRE
ncbi:response regulator [Paenibacillus piri]|nr:response regulator [Paenibacillus piri]